MKRRKSINKYRPTSRKPQQKGATLKAEKDAFMSAMTYAAIVGGWFDKNPISENYSDEYLKLIGDGE